MLNIAALSLALTLAAVFAGALFGGAARYALTRIIHNAHAATFAANTVACAVAGFAATHPVAWQIALGAGFAGALSTWSTFARELLSLIHISEPTRRHHVSRMPSSA